MHVLHLAPTTQSPKTSFFFLPTKTSSTSSSFRVPEGLSCHIWELDYFAAPAQNIEALESETRTAKRYGIVYALHCCKRRALAGRAGAQGRAGQISAPGRLFRYGRLALRQGWQHERQGEKGGRAFHPNIDRHMSVSCLSLPSHKCYRREPCSHMILVLFHCGKN
jgi:hypothetical protein